MLYIMYNKLNKKNSRLLVPYWKYLLHLDKMILWI